MRLELVGLDGATAYVSAEEVGRTVGSLRRWASARAGLPSPSLLRLKSGCRDLCSDQAPLSEVDARVQALLRLPGGTHNKYFFSGRLEGVRKTPEAGNEPQQFNAPGEGGILGMGNNAIVHHVELEAARRSPEPPRAVTAPGLLETHSSSDIGGI